MFFYIELIYNNYYKATSMSSASEKTNKKTKYTLIILTILAVSILVFLGINFATTSNATSSQKPVITKDTTSEEISEEFIKAVMPVVDSTDNYVVLSEPKDVTIALDPNAGTTNRTVFLGRRVNIAVTGVDSRLGAGTKHADANHVISLLLDSGKIEIYSVPRDTHADCGYDDSTGLNKLTIMRASHGRNAYLKELARITRLDKIHYWAEFGFSQAMGLIEFLGYREAPQTLQVLRSRRGLGGDDYQRVYNQAQFIKQAMVRQFSRFDGAMGSLLMRGLLTMVETNLDYATASELFDKMQKAGFPRHSSDVSIYIRPPMPIKFKIYDFQNPETVVELRHKIENFNQSRLEKYDEQLTPRSDVTARLKRFIAKAAQDTLKNPTRSINTLKVLFEQRAWFQVQDTAMRNQIREDFTKILVESYKKKKQYDNAEAVLRIVQNEKAIFKTQTKTAQ